MKVSVVLLPSLWRKLYSIAKLRDKIRRETLSPSERKAQGSSEDTVTFLEVRFYIDFEVSLVGKRFKGFRDSAIIIRRGSWKWAWRRVILRGAPADLHSRVLSLYCPVTFFDGCVGRITSKLRGEEKPTILEQSDCASSLDFSCQSLNWSFEWFASLHHRFRLVESWPDRTKLRTRANSLSFLDLF